MQLSIGIVGVLCLFLAVAEGHRGGGPKGPGPLGELCANSTDTKITCFRKARACAKEFHDVFDDDDEDNNNSDEDNDSSEEEDDDDDFDLEALRTNITECATELGITLPELPTRGLDGQGKRKGPGGRRGGRRGGKPGGKPEGPGGRGGIFDRIEEAIGAENVTLLRECLLDRQGKLTADGLIDREPARAAFQNAFLDDIPTQEAVLEALDTCPEPTDFKIEELMQCLGTACIETITI